MKRKKYLVQISNRQMERCAEIAILDRQNAEIEHQQTHKKQVQNWRFLNPYPANVENMVSSK